MVWLRIVVILICCILNFIFLVDNLFRLRRLLISWINCWVFCWVMCNMFFICLGNLFSIFLVIRFNDFEIEVSGVCNLWFIVVINWFLSILFCWFLDKFWMINIYCKVGFVVLWIGVRVSFKGKGFLLVIVSVVFYLVSNFVVLDLFFFLVLFLDNCVVNLCKWVFKGDLVVLEGSFNSLVVV